MRRFVVTTEGPNRLGLRELCEQFANDQWSAAHMTAEQAAAVLNFQVHDIAVLMAAGLLKPLGKPAQNAPKFFAAKTVLELGRDEQWLHKATLAVARHWQGKNARRQQSGDDPTA